MRGSIPRVQPDSHLASMMANAVTLRKDEDHHISGARALPQLSTLPASTGSVCTTSGPKVVNAADVMVNAQVMTGGYEGLSRKLEISTSYHQFVNSLPGREPGFCPLAPTMVLGDFFWRSTCKHAQSLNH